MEAPKLETYEVWEDVGDCSHLMTTAVNAVKDKKLGILSSKAKLIDIVQAATWEEAMSIWNLRRGFEPYYPFGESAECPNICGQWYWPEGSGYCPRCGDMNNRRTK